MVVLLLRVGVRKSHRGVHLRRKSQRILVWYQVFFWKTLGYAKMYEMQFKLYQIRNNAFSMYWIHKSGLHEYNSLDNLFDYFSSSTSVVAKIGLPYASWYITFKWIWDTIISSLTMKDLPRMPLKALQHNIVTKLKATFISRSPSPTVTGKSMAPWWWVIK